MQSIITIDLPIAINVAKVEFRNSPAFAALVIDLGLDGVASEYFDQLQVVGFSPDINLISLRLMERTFGAHDDGADLSIQRFVGCIHELVLRTLGLNHVFANSMLMDHRVLCNDWENGQWSVMLTVSECVPTVIQ